MDLLGLPIDRLLNVLTSYRVDDRIPTVQVQVSEQRSELWNRERIRTRDAGAEPTTATPRSIDEEDRETWGLKPEHLSGQRAVIAMIGPPAPPRPA